MRFGAWFVGGGVTYGLLQSEERSGHRDRGPSRRSKSEGPPGESEYRTRYLSPKARLRNMNMRCDSELYNSEQDASLVVRFICLSVAQIVKEAFYSSVVDFHRGTSFIMIYCVFRFVTNNEFTSPSHVAS